MLNSRRNSRSKLSTTLTINLRAKIKEGIVLWCIRFLERDMISVPIDVLSKEQTDGLLAQLWDVPAFRNYVKERNSKIIYSIAGAAGSEPEPRDKSRLLMGQRVEILILAAKAKTAASRRDERQALKKVPKQP